MGRSTGMSFSWLSSSSARASSPSSTRRPISNSQVTTTSRSRRPSSSRATKSSSPDHQIKEQKQSIGLIKKFDYPLHTLQKVYFFLKGFRNLFAIFLFFLSQEKTRIGQAAFSHGIIKKLLTGSCGLDGGVAEYFTILFDGCSIEELALTVVFEFEIGEHPFGSIGFDELVEVAVVIDHIHLLVHELDFVQNLSASRSVDALYHLVVDQQQILGQHDVEVNRKQVLIGVISSKSIQYFRESSPAVNQIKQVIEFDYFVLLFEFEFEDVVND